MVMIGGEKLQLALEGIARNAADASLKVGFMAGSTERDGTPTPQVAFWNEFGTSRTPARPFFRSMIAEQSPGWSMRLQKAMTATGNDSRRALALLGVSIQGDLQQSIRGWQDPPNAPSTIKAKGFNKPLIDHNDMVNAVDYEVSE